MPPHTRIAARATAVTGAAVKRSVPIRSPAKSGSPAATPPSASLTCSLLSRPGSVPIFTRRQR